MIAQDQRPLPPLAGSNLHIMGIRGRGLAPLAAAAVYLGADVTGCDSGGFDYTRDLLEEANVPVAGTHDPSHVSGRHLVITASAKRDDAEVEAAASSGRLHRRMDLAAAVMRARRGFGVCGSHGKGTVAALTSLAAIESGLDPMCVIGVDSPETEGAFRAGSGPSVMEVDESDLAAHFVKVEVAAVTNLDWDHPHLGTTVGESLATVKGFVGNARQTVVLGPTGRQAELADAASANTEVWRVGTEIVARVTAYEPAGARVRIIGPEGETVETVIRLVGPRTAANAAVAYGGARALGAGAEEAAAGLGRLTRLRRRLEPLGCHAGVHVYDDFGGKHPVNVRHGIEALRRRHPSARITAIFQPVFASTVQRWGWRYARALKLADAVVILPTSEHSDYPATTGSSEGWLDPIADRVLQADSVEAAAGIAVAGSRGGDVIVGFMQLHNPGIRLGEELISALESS